MNIRFNQDAWIATGIAVVGLLVFSLTAAPSVFLGDSAELSAAMYNLGVAHPPGYPLYLLLGKLFTLVLPFGDIGFRANILSGLFAAAGMALVYLLGRKLGLARSSAAGGALLAGFSASFWSQAVVAEVYTLAGLFFLLVLFTTIHWSQTNSNRVLVFSAFLMGLALTHHLAIAVMYPVVLVFIISRQPGLVRNPGLVVKCLAAPTVALCLYVYIPIRARADIPNDWNNPETFLGMLNHILAGQYQGKLLAHGFAGFVHQIKRFIDLLPGQFGLLLLLFSGLGIGVGMKKFRPQNLFMLGVLVINLLFSFVYYINDIEPYFIPAFLLLAFYSGVGLDHVGRIIPRIAPGIPAFFSKVVLLLFAALVPLLTNWTLCDRSGNLLPRRFGLNLLDSVEANGIIIAAGDNAVGLLAYFHIVEKTRPDVTIYAETQNIFRFPIFNETYHPRDINQASIAAYERGLIQSARPIYFTDIFDDSYPLKPHGLLYRLVKGETETPGHNAQPWSRYDLRGLDDPDLYDDGMTRVLVAKTLLMRAISLWGVQPDNTQSDQYASRAAEVAQHQTLALKDIGKFYLQTNRIAAADNIFRRALQADPFDPELHNLLGIIATMKNRLDAAIGHFSYVIEKNPHDLLAVYNRANAYERNADKQPNERARQEFLQKAMKDLQKALAIDPSDPQAQSALGRVYTKLQSRF